MYFNANINVADEQYLRTYNVMRLGDIAFEGHSNKEFSHGRFVENYIGDGIVSHIFTVLRPRVPFDVNYWRYAINNEKIMRLSLIRSTKASTMMHDLVPSDFLREAIPTPTLAEQKEIGAFLVGLDHLITLHQRKYDKLCTVKKSMLDKMFPKPGETEPEVRFKGFTDPWEQRKLGELFVESDERSSTEEILSVSVANGIYPASESERDTNPGASIANYKIVRVGDIVYNSMRMWQGAVGSSRYNGIVSPAYVVAKPVVELDSTCFGYLLKRPELLYKYLCNSQGNSKDTQTLRYERFAEITAEVPSTIEEQRAISDCLEGLDNLITLHQREPTHMMKEGKNANRYQ